VKDMNVSTSEEELFTAALEIEASQRGRFLDHACGDNAQLRRRVEALLRRHEQSRGLLDKPPPGIAAANGEPMISEAPGTIIGPYKVLEQIGEGGFGVVFMAEQEGPLRRCVALKVIKPGMDSRQVIARFEAERQALAMMDHPNIAKVFDAGATETGRPYFVMELVQGVPIGEYCNQCQLTTRERLELFVTVCRAIEHAHQRGVIHRDLKPTNVLVAMQDGRPAPKIIDFGVAKAACQPMSEHTLHTGFAQMLGTPLYMSPEQAELSPLGVDARTDIYSLGVLLYELLTGTTPFDKQRLRTAPYDEVRRIIREEEPLPPSSRISTLAADLATTIAEQRRTEPRRLRQIVRGDLDLIVMKCLDKDRRRRYETAGALAADVHRYLQDEPVEARPPSVAYRVRKFARRHKMAVAAATAVVGLAASTLVIAWQRYESRLQRQRATQLAEDARQRLYVANMKLAFRSWTAGDAAAALQILERHRPRPGREDLRSFGWHYLWGQVALVHGNAPTLLGHTGEVYFVTYSPDGARLATASQDGTVRVWDAARFETQLTLRGHVGEVTGVSFSPDGRTLASAGEDHTVRLWDAHSGKELKVLRAHTDTVFNAVFSPDGTLLASGGADKVVRLWDPGSGNPIATLPGHSDDVEHLAFSPDGRLLATAGGEHANVDSPSVKLWNVANRTERATLHGHGVDVLCVAFSPDGRILASASSDRTIKLWDIAVARELRTLRGDGSDVHSVVFLHEGKTLASASRDGAVRLWDVASGRQLRGGQNHAGRVWSLAYRPQGRWLAAAGDDRMVRFWDLEASIVPPRHNLPIEANHLGAVAMSHDAKWLATIDKDGPYKMDGRLWDAANGSEILRFGQGSRYLSEALAFPPSSTTLAFYSDGNLRLLDITSGNEQLKVEMRDPPLRVAISPSGDLLATCAHFPGAPITIWRTDTAEVYDILETEGLPVTATFFSPDGRTLAALPAHAGDRRSEAWIWDVQTRRFRGRLADEGHGGNCLAFSPDGKIIATVGGLTARLWDAETLGLRTTMSGHHLAVTRCAFSPDGRTLATGSDDQTVRLWHVATGQELFTLEGHTGPIRYVAFYPDGRRLLSAAVAADGHGEFFVWSAGKDHVATESSPAPIVAN
jgi:WD40 repeat protein/serine/threonine protein kinase